MSEFIISPSAKEDLWAIWSFIAVENHNPAAAERLEAEIVKACGKLARMPDLAIYGGI